MRTLIQNFTVAMGLILTGAVLTGTANAQCATLGRGGAVFHHQSRRNSGTLPTGSLLLASNQSEEDAIVGMWHVTFTAEGNNGNPPDGTQIDSAIVQWHSDRTEIMNSGRPAQDGNFCLGVWERTGQYRYKLNHFALGNDTQNAPSGIGNPAGPTHIVEKVVLSPDGNHYAGSFVLDAYDTSDTMVAHIVGVIVGTRITVNTPVSKLF